MTNTGHYNTYATGMTITSLYNAGLIITSLYQTSILTTGLYTTWMLFIILSYLYNHYQTV